MWSWLHRKTRNETKFSELFTQKQTLKKNKIKTNASKETRKLSYLLDKSDDIRTRMQRHAGEWSDYTRWNDFFPLFWTRNLFVRLLIDIIFLLLSLFKKEKTFNFWEKKEKKQQTWQKHSIPVAFKISRRKDERQNQRNINLFYKYVWV